MIIRNSLSGISFSSDELLMIPHNAISDIQIKIINNREKLRIDTLPGYYSVPEHYEFWHDEVTSPVTVNATALKTVLLAYSNGYDEVDTLVATPGQTVFTFEKPFTTKDMLVLIDGISTRDFEVTDTGEITFNSALSGGETITIINNK